MKSNPALQATLRCTNPAQKVMYAARVLKAACTSSPAVIVRAAVPAVAAKPAVIAQTAKSARAASPAVTGANNTVGYAFGAIYLNSPAYPIGTPIPAIPAKPASAAVAAQPAIVAVPAVTAVSSPAVVAIKGYEDAISIVTSESLITVTAELPTSASVGIVGSDKLVIGEITPTALQAKAWIDTPANIAPVVGLAGDIATETLEQYLYRNALLCEHVVTDVLRNVNGVMTNCKRIVVTLYPSATFDLASKLAQLSKISATQEETSQPN